VRSLLKLKGKLLVLYRGVDYAQVGLRHALSTKTQTHVVHRLMLFAFVGPPPHPTFQAMHLDGNGRNNKLSNLRWGSPKENRSHQELHGTSTKGSRNGRATITEAQAKVIKAAIRGGGLTHREIADGVGVSFAVVRLMVQGRWKHVAFPVEEPAP